MKESAMKKKILYIVEAMGGGVFTYVVAMANKLADKYDVYILYAERPQTPKDYKNYFDDRVHLIKSNNMTRSISPNSDLKAFLEVKRVARKIQPDVIHLHSSKAGILGRWAFNGKKVPLFYTPHGYSFLMEDYASMKRKLYYYIEKFSARKYCTTISCSEGEHKESLKLTKNARYVNNGVNCKEIDAIVSTLQAAPDAARTVATLGRISYQKNPKLFNKIALAMPEVHFIWIGDGDLREQLTAPNIEITGWVKRKEALEILTRADIFMLPSLWEGLPISLLEAMYMKKMCIVSNVIGNRDVIHNGKNGFVCTSVADYTAAIQECINERQTKFIDAAYQEILTEYNTDVMAQRYIEIYEEAMNR